MEVIIGVKDKSIRESLTALLVIFMATSLSFLLLNYTLQLELQLALVLA